MDEARISFLLKASQLLPPKQHITKLLKSYYLRNIKQAVGDELSTSNRSAFGDKRICKRCFAPWCDGDFNLTYKPGVVRSPRARKLVEALNKGEKLSKRQKIRAKWYRKRLKSAVITTCNLCKKKTPLYLDKPREMPKKLEEEEEEEEEEKEVVLKTKRKKKKDKTAGLKISSSRQPVTQKQHQQNPMKPAKKDKQILPSSHTVKKAKENQKNTKIVSKTQKKNTLLQLAAMLKASSKPGSSSNDRLKNLLK